MPSFRVVALNCLNMSVFLKIACVFLRKRLLGKR